MGKSKKVVLFIVEGECEETIYEDLLFRLIENNNTNAECYQYGGDITHLKSASLDKKLKEHIKRFLDERHFYAKDLLSIVLVSDTDGVFVDESLVVSSNNKIKYYDDRIECKDTESQLAVMRTKSENLRELTKTNQIVVNKIPVPFSIYFNSSNLDHLLYNIRNLKDKFKTAKAEEFVDQYINNLSDFETFLKQEEINTGNDYEESWEYIQ